MRSKQYLIELPKLRQGLNEFEFVIDSAFLSEFEYSPVREANAKVALQLFKSATLLDLHFTLTGTVVQPCDQCLVQIPLPVSDTFTLVIKFSDEKRPSDDEIVYLHRNDHEYDLKQFLYESFLLAIPSRKTCDNITGEKPCDEAVLAKLRNDSEDNGKGNPAGETDPRWEKLKTLLNNN